MATSLKHAKQDPEIVGGETKSPEKRWTARVGIVCSVGYFDPPSWGVDLQAGSQYGYKLLFVVLLSGLFAAFLQVSAFLPVGSVWSLVLISHPTVAFFSTTDHTIRNSGDDTDLSELLGSATALSLLFPALPLWAGVLITGADVLLILALGNPLRDHKPVKIFEWIVIALVLAVLICIAIIIAKTDIVWGQAFDGFLPSHALFVNGALYTSVGILGATVMPHSLFLGSHLATQDRLYKKSLASVSPLSDNVREREPTGVASGRERLRRFGQGLWQNCRSSVIVSRVELEEVNARPNSHERRENNALEFVQSHLYHSMVDVVSSLLGFAVIINALILILASAVFYYGSGAQGSESPASLFDAHTLINNTIGKVAALLFALALLASGQSASIVATVAGQSVSEGFLNWKVSPVVRRLVTRLLGLIPSMTVVIVVGPSGINFMLVASQVILSILLPFITLPLIYLTSSSRIMRVRKMSSGRNSISPLDKSEDFVDFSSGKLMTSFGCLIWLVIVVANVYVLVTIAMGQGG